jgi:hypothetical protein
VHILRLSSDAEGVYSIGSLAAGSYYISAAAQPIFMRNTVQKGTEETYMITYYPGVIDAAAASTVQVAAGGIARGTDIRMRKVRAY